jgi:hypothetical protein
LLVLLALSFGADAARRRMVRRPMGRSGKGEIPDEVCPCGIADPTKSKTLRGRTTARNMNKGRSK